MIKEPVFIVNNTILEFQHRLIVPPVKSSILIYRKKRNVDYLYVA